MSARDYGQYCGLARALDVVGERWGLLIVRDLLSGPHRFGELQAGLPRIPSNVLTNRLKELEAAGVVRRELLPAPARGTAYALTDDGRALEPVLVALGQWGAPRLGEPREGEVVTAASFAMALRTTFRPEAARGREGKRTAYEVRMGDLVVTATVERENVDVIIGGGRSPDLVIETGPQIKALMAGDLSTAEAIASGVVRLEGDPALLERFARQFRI
jgi:DNA-binding HxlR family transcriptional regulator